MFTDTAMYHRERQRKEQRRKITPATPNRQRPKAINRKPGTPTRQSRSTTERQKEYTEGRFSLTCRPAGLPACKCSIIARSPANLRTSAIVTKALTRKALSIQHLQPQCNKKVLQSGVFGPKKRIGVPGPIRNPNHAPAPAAVGYLCTSRPALPFFVRQE